MYEGTAGGFKRKGAAIGDAFISSQIANHDRRIPIPGGVLSIYMYLCVYVCMYVCMYVKMKHHSYELIYVSRVHRVR